MPYLKTVYSEDDYVFVEVASDAYELYQEDVFNTFHHLRQEQYQTFIASIVTGTSASKIMTLTKVIMTISDVTRCFIPERALAFLTKR